jgi:tellurite resistance protein
MALSKDQGEFYQRTREITRRQIADLNAEMEEELRKVRERIESLRASVDSAKQIYDVACKMLGVENDLEKDEEEPAD